MTETQLQKVFARPLAELRAWARARDITDTSVRGIYDHYLTAKCCAGCGTPTNWGQDIRAYREFCSLACVSASKDIVARRRATCKTRYGVEEANHAPAIARKKLRTFRRNYGVDNPSQVESVKAKKTATMQANFGASHWAKVVESHFDTNNPMKHKAIKDKIKATCMSKYGVDNPSKHADTKAKIKATHIERYGMPNVGHKPHMYSRKKFVDRFGVKHIVQGYEPQAIEWLQRKLSIVRIVSASAKLPQVKYHLNGKSHVYHPDLVIYTESTRHLIEVKSEFTIRLDADRLQAKFDAAQKFMEKRNGNFWVIVITKTGVHRFNKVPVKTILKQLGLKAITQP